MTAVYKSRKGFTLIELLVAIAIMAIMGTIIGYVVSFCYRSYDQNNKMTDAHNLAILTIQEIQNKVKYSNAVELSSPPSWPTAAGDKYIYYEDDGVGGLRGVVFQGKNANKSWYSQGSYKKFKGKLSFSLSHSNLLTVKLSISDTKGNLLYGTTTSICLMNISKGTASATDQTMIKYGDSPTP